MSEKIVLTVLQDKRINNFLKGAEKQDVMERHFEGWRDENNKCLSVLSIDQMARILYEPNSYEVEQPRIKENDWVTRIMWSTCGRPQFAEGRTFKAINISGGSGCLIKDSDNGYHGVGSLRPATKEEIFWAELGREVGEFKTGDITTDCDGRYYKINRDLPGNTSKTRYVNGELKGLYPASSFIKFPDKS